MIADLKANSTTTAKVNSQGGHMAEQESPLGVDLFRVARIVASYVRRHQIGSDQLAGLIAEVHRALTSLGRATPVQEPPKPAVAVRRSVE
jgi:predicted transcriptional regulator